MEHHLAGLIEALRHQVSRLERGGSARPRHPVLPFGVTEIDAALPGQGLAAGAVHEWIAGGPDIEQGAAPALMAAGVLARRTGKVLWISERRDLFAPGLAGVGLHPDRVIYAEAGNAAGVLLVLEEGLRHAGLAGVVGEVSGRLSLTASRRLQLAAEQSGGIGFLLRRSRKHDDPVLSEPSAAATRWRVSTLPSPAPLPHAPGTPGLAPARWRLDLLRCRGGESASWMVEACDAKGRLRLVADMADRSVAPAQARHRIAG